MFGFNFPDQHLEYHEADLKFIRDIINDTWHLDRAHVTDDYDKSIQAPSADNPVAVALMQIKLIIFLF